MRVFRAAAIMALLVGPAYAQDHVLRYGEEAPEKSLQQIQSEKDADKAYKRSLGNIPDKGVTADPWGTARSADPPKPAVKPAANTAAKAKPTKTGSNAN